MGGFYTGREAGDSFNRVNGADGSIRVTQAGALGFHAFGSSTQQLGSDETAGGHAALVNYTHDSRDMSLYFQALDISQGFDTWTGYLTRAGVLQASALFRPRIYPNSATFRRVEPQFISDYVRDAESGIWEKWNEGGVTFVLPRAARAQVKYHWSTEVFAGQEFGTSGFLATGSIQVTRDVQWQDDRLVPGRDLVETRRGFFIKASYLWRL